MDNVLIYNAPDENATRMLGRALAATLPEVAIVALIGPLGAGKTRLVQAVAEAASVKAGAVTSPTFVLVHEYAGRVPIFHFDVYRIRDEDEFLALGPEEYFSRPGWTFIEWANRVSNCLPRNRLEIVIEQSDSSAPAARRFTISAYGDSYMPAVAALRNQTGHWSASGR